MKTRLYTRKRALISSVAMLLVAMIALGTATFAWFTKSTAATAHGINVKTIKASDLQIASATGKWSTTVDYKVANQVLMPASSATGKAWFTTDAEKRDVFTRNPKTAVTNITNNYIGSDTAEGSDMYYFKEQLNIRNNGTAAVNNVTISFNIPVEDNYKYLRVAFEEAKGKNDFTPKPNSSQTFSSLIFDADKTAYDALNAISAADSALSTTKITPVAHDTVTCTVSVGNLAGKTVSGEGESATEVIASKYYNVYLWYEGQDVDCTSDHAGIELKDISFGVTGETVQS